MKKKVIFFLLFLCGIGLSIMGILQLYDTSHGNLFLDRHAKTEQWYTRFYFLYFLAEHDPLVYQFVDQSEEAKIKEWFANTNPIKCGGRADEWGGVEGHFLSYCGCNLIVSNITFSPKPQGGWLVKSWEKLFWEESRCYKSSRLP